MTKKKARVQKAKNVPVKMTSIEKTIKEMYSRLKIKSR